MTYLFSLYDALIGINVPSDKALAVVEAMERDMGTMLATKTDLDSLRVATQADLEVLRLALKADVALLQKDLDAKYLLLRLEIETTREVSSQDFNSALGSLRKELDSTRDTLRLEI